MTAQKLTLKPDWREKKKATARSYPLAFDWPALINLDNGLFNLKLGDTVPIEIEITAGPKDIGQLYIHSFHLVSWPSSIAASHQFFSTAFREDPDNPDGAIMLQGFAKFEEVQKKAAARKGRRTVDPSIRTRYFGMTFPDPPPIVRLGRFAYLVSLTIGRRPDEGRASVTALPLLKSFILDPEVDVEPSGGGGPDPTPRRTRRGR
jgi:hypothetical protein